MKDEIRESLDDHFAALELAKADQAAKQAIQSDQRAADNARANKIIDTMIAPVLQELSSYLKGKKPNAYFFHDERAYTHSTGLTIGPKSLNFQQDGDGYKVRICRANKETDSHTGSSHSYETVTTDFVEKLATDFIKDAMTLASQNR
jgi:hypothetical protein